MTDESMDDAPPVPFYIAEAGHKYTPGETFPHTSSNQVPGITSEQQSHWVALHTDGSRSVVGYVTSLQATHHHDQADKLLAANPGSDVYYIRHPGIVHAANARLHPKRRLFIDYDWSISVEEVNQWAYLPEWRADVARFCHSFDALPSFESFRQLSAVQKATAYRVGQTIGGHAWERLGFWLTYDAALSEDWKLGIVFDPVEKARNAVCTECQSVVAALHLALSINATSFAAKLAAGRIHGTDRTAAVWEPGVLLTIVPETTEEVTVETAISRLVASYNGARDYYRRHVAHEVISHDH